MKGSVLKEFISEMAHLKRTTINKSTGRESERWKTTSESALLDVASQLSGQYDNASRVKNMKARKLQNNTTSINFGNEHINYISDAQENQLKCQGGATPAERARQRETIKKMKADLTVTNFCLGDEVPDYSSVNSDAMAESDMWRGKNTRLSMNTELKAAIKKSSVHFGNEKVAYHTVGQDSMQFHGGTNDFKKLKEETEKLKTSLRTHNFVLGDEKVLYQSDYQQGYGSLPAEAYGISGNEKERIRNIIDDSRACHFSLGNDQPLYESCNQFAAKTIVGKSAVGDLQKQKEHSKKLKMELQRTSIVIGDDATYM